MDSLRPLFSNRVKNMDNRGIRSQSARDRGLGRPLVTQADWRKVPSDQPISHECWRLDYCPWVWSAQTVGNLVHLNSYWEVKRLIEIFLIENNALVIGIVISRVFFSRGRKRLAQRLRPLCMVWFWFEIKVFHSKCFRNKFAQCVSK